MFAELTWWQFGVILRLYKAIDDLVSIIEFWTNSRSQSSDTSKLPNIISLIPATFTIGAKVKADIRTQALQQGVALAGG